ncbi:MAG TPA: hypothetical protein GXX14_03415 [Clostridiaceae bacterium]|nr:hypothetical protein [Clostridiaceae bacterium]
MCEEKGKKNWVFCDGDLPPAGDKEPYGHEALMVVNLNDETADLSIDILFEDKEPVRNITQKLEGQRVICIRLDKPIGDQKYKIPPGQYALVLHSNVPVVAVFGRLDVRQPNLAYYSVQGYAY